MYQSNKKRNNGFRVPRRKPRTRLERIEQLKRAESSLTRKLKGKFNTTYDMFETLGKLEAVQKDIEIQMAYEQHETNSEAA